MDTFDVLFATSQTFIDFCNRPGNGFWPRLDRADIASGILKRMADPNSFSQRRTSFCGPATFLSGVSRDMPGVFAQFAMDLYETGKGTIITKSFAPRVEVRRSGPIGDTAPIDFMLLTSIRDSENSFLSPMNSNETWSDIASITLPNEMVNWYRAAGYHPVFSKSRLARAGSWQDSKVYEAVEELNYYLQLNYKVAMLIDSDILTRGTQDSSSSLADHWVGLLSYVMVGGQRWRAGTASSNSSGPVSFDVFSWGTKRSVPQYPTDPLTVDSFVSHWYGYVAGHPMGKR